MSRPPLQFGNFGGQTLQIARLIQQTRAQQNNVPRRGGDALAEPESAGVIFLGVVDRLERLRPDALHIPQMKELVRRQIAERISGFSASRLALMSMAVE